MSQSLLAAEEQPPALLESFGVLEQFAALGSPVAQGSLGEGGQGVLLCPQPCLAPSAAWPRTGPPADPHLCSLFPSSLYNAVVPSCGPFEGLSLSSRSPEQTPPTLALGPGPPGTPMGLFRLLLGQDSHLAPGTGSRWAPSLHLQHPEPQPHPVPGQGGLPPRNSIFSWNLVEKLQRLGLDKVVARGEKSCAQPGPRGAWGTQK